MISGQNNGKNSGHAIEMLFFFCGSKKKNLRMMAKNYQNPSKAVAKAMKTSAKQMEKGWGLHFSAVLNLQLISRFPDFLQVRVKGVRTKPKE